ncbi:hypothetical protein [Pseudoduganella sp. R-34]|uniref:hypothetical protein n=1 Tax=Pseudoduganella sp. R-34 TaxID=3404062 RepID=UPI003CF1567E
MDEPKIYLDLMQESLERLAASEKYLAGYTALGHRCELESAALQLRKAMEAVAFAAIAPNKQMYAAFRKSASKPAHYGADWQANSIFLSLKEVNPDFYPDPLLPETRVGPNSWHFDRPVDGYMKQNNFESLYKRLGKYLHADNPWGDDKGWDNFAKGLPDAIMKIRALLKKHRTIIRAPEFNGVWIVDAPSDGTPPRMIRAVADGPFTTNAAT